jgi:predicted Zn-dependent protease
MRELLGCRRLFHGGRALLLLLGGAFVVAGCANQPFNQVGASILSSTGYVSSTEAERLLGASARAVESQDSLSAEQEYYLGRAVSANILGTYQPVTTNGVMRYVNQVGMTIASVSDVPETFGGYHFAVVESDEVNAFAAPGGFIYVSTGFVRRLPDEDALAAVLAHEVAHVNLKHGVSAISNAKLFSALGELTKQGVSIAGSHASTPVDLTALTNTLAESVTGVTDKLLRSGFDRSQEYQADLYAARLLERAGYDPNALVRVLNILGDSQAGDGEGWYATHPAPKKRISELDDDFDFAPPRAENPKRTARFVETMR